MGVLVDLAREILIQAEALESQMQAASAVQPTFEANSQHSYPPWSNHPDIFRTRSALIEASKSMFRLALGPSDSIVSMLNSEKLQGYILNAINHYQIYDIVPLNESISFANLAAKIGVQQDLLTRIMRFAFSMHVFKEDPPGCISHTSLSLAMKPIASWTWLLHRPDFNLSFGSWPTAMQAYSEPRIPGTRQLAFQLANNTDSGFFDKLKTEPGAMKSFGEAMRSYAARAGVDQSYLVKSFDWASLGQGPVVDLGGGNGHISLLLAKHFPDLHFVVQDLPGCEEGANNLIPAQDKKRITFQAQDFFEPQTKALGARVFFLKAIMHDWPDDKCSQILQNLIPGVETGAKIVLVDRILPPFGRKATHLESFALFMDLLMFTMLGAKERSIEQWRSVVAKADSRLKIEKVFQPVGSEQGVLVVGM